MIKIALLIDTWFPLVGGGQINAYEISRRLVARDIKIDIITRNNGNYKLKLPRGLRVIKLGRYANSYNSFSKVLFIVRSFLFVLKGDYDLVHAHAFLPGLAAKSIKLAKHIPAVFTVHGFSVNTDLNNYFIKQLEKFILTNLTYDTQITVSRDFLKIKNNNKNVVYIENGVDISSFDKIKTQKFKNPTVIFVGRLHPQKNLSTLLKAMAKVHKHNPKVKLLIVGKGSQKLLLQRLISKLNLDKTVKLIGELPKLELIKLYKSCHLFILPSIYEGQPLSLLEAWAAKIPCVSTTSGDCQFLIRPGNNGYLIENIKDDNEIARKIISALENKKLNDLGLNGYSLVKNFFTWRGAAAKTLQTYKDLIDD